MGKVKQLEKNAKLSEKLAEYIASNPSVTKDLPSGVSFVVFSSSDNQLNKLNQELVKSLKSEGKKVVRAEEKENKKQFWSFNLAV